MIDAKLIVQINASVSNSTLFFSLQTELVIEPRYPMFGGWKTTFTIGYGLPLEDFLFESEGKLFLNISFGSPVNDLIIDYLIVKVGALENVSYSNAV